jgi:hypothetical protein
MHAHVYICTHSLLKLLPFEIIAVQPTPDADFAVLLQGLCCSSAFAAEVPMLQPSAQRQI